MTPEEKALYIVNQFSSENHVLLLNTLREIISLMDFNEFGIISYKLQSPSMHPKLAKERLLLKKLGQLGLFIHLGEDSLFGMTRLKIGRPNIIKETITILENITVKSAISHELKRDDYIAKISTKEDVQKIKQNVNNKELALMEENKCSHIKMGWTVIFTFPHNWSNKYKYFKCLWFKNGTKASNKELYEYESKLIYPSKDIWKINRNIRTTINKLRKELSAQKVPITIETNKGYQIRFL